MYLDIQEKEQGEYEKSRKKEELERPRRREEEKEYERGEDEGSKIKKRKGREM